ncbi:MAG TPA: aminotransferase class V-fold PLP-dependent enzyme, partial [Longimicrobiales bacterium]|nr:aminotransferase class V-fold PLP-dependent enzyme [Longimicrobiales bacterium]
RRGPGGTCPARRTATRTDGVSDFVYMDFAATSARRPAAVAEAMLGFMTDVGATPGRGGHRLANEAGRIALRCRQRVAALLGIPGDPGRIAFMANATHALNTALRGTVGRGDKVVLTVFDHNAVLRPAARLAVERDVRVAIIPGTPDGHIDEAILDRELDGARLLVINGASNVLGTALDIAGLAARARAAGALSLLDAAQTAGHLPFDAAAAGIDMLAYTGHKGMLGPQGVGGLWVREGIDVEPLLRGGTGGDSMNRDMPRTLPDRLEAGTQNGPGIAGLAAGIDAVLETGVAAAHARLADLKARLREGLAAVPGVRVLSPPAPRGVPIVTIVADGIDPATLAGRLDREHAVLTRAGLHCAPEVHRMLGTDRTGAVRFSLGWSSTADDVARAIQAVDAVVRPAAASVRWGGGPA